MSVISFIFCTGPSVFPKSQLISMGFTISYGSFHLSNFPAFFYGAAVATCERKNNNKVLPKEVKQSCQTKWDEKKAIKGRKAILK